MYKNIFCINWQWLFRKDMCVCVWRGILFSVVMKNKMTLLRNTKKCVRCSRNICWIDDNYNFIDFGILYFWMGRLFCWRNDRSVESVVLQHNSGISKPLTYRKCHKLVEKGWDEMDGKLGIYRKQNRS